MAVKLGLELIGFAGWKESLKSLPAEFHDAIEAKTRELVSALKEKVIENVSGRLLNQKTGALAKSIESRVRVDSRVMYGWVGPRPQNAKAWVHELGGKDYYVIVPSEEDALKFYWDKVGHWVRMYKVYHPPAEAKYYLRTALEEMEGTIYEAYSNMIDEVIGELSG